MNNTHETVDSHQNITNVKHFEDENIATIFIYFHFLCIRDKKSIYFQS